MTEQPPTQLQKAYVRVRDFAGEPWTIPSGPAGSKLHELLWSDVELGFPDQFIPAELIHSPWRGLDFVVDIAGGVESWLKLRGFQPSDQQHQAAERLYRVGQFARLQARTEHRRQKAP